jgi:hypothetical protein
MSDRSLNPTPSWGAVALEQLRMLALLQRRDLIAVALIGGLIMASASYGLLMLGAVDTRPAELHSFAFGVPLVLIGLMWPLGMWRHGRPGQRDYFWTLPVARGPHMLLRVGLGWVLLVGVLLFVLAIGAFVLAAFVTRWGDPALPLSHWFAPLITASLAYLLVSALAVQLDNPVRWALWGLVAVFGLRVITAAAGFTPMGGAIDVLIGSLRDALAGPFATQRWVTSYLAWLTVAALAVVFGAFRHREES